MIPEPPVTWHEGPCYEDANGEWWDVEFVDDQTFVTHRGTGERLLVAESVLRSRPPMIPPSLGDIEWLPPDSDGNMSFKDGNDELWVIKHNEGDGPWLIHVESQQRTLWAGQCWPRVLHYGPGGEFLPDGQPRIRMEPKGFLARFLYAWRAARPKG